MASAVATIMLAIAPILVVYWIVARRTGLVAQS
jgi:hypothetical protein